MIPAILERCAGIDVGKSLAAVCLMTGEAAAEPRVEYRSFGTFTADLEQMRDWLVEAGCTHVLMESTGSYWKPIFNVLEEHLKVHLANAEDVKGRKGHKTDKQDSWGLAHLFRHGMVRSSFIPPRAIRELRDLTRRRRKVLGMATSEKNRIAKVLEDANVKLGSVLSNLFGVSGQLMLEALLEDKATPEQIAQFARRRAREKIPQIAVPYGTAPQFVGRGVPGKQAQRGQGLPGPHHPRQPLAAQHPDPVRLGGGTQQARAVAGEILAAGGARNQKGGHRHCSRPVATGISGPRYRATPSSMAGRQLGRAAASSHDPPPHPLLGPARHLHRPHGGPSHPRISLQQQAETPAPAQSAVAIFGTSQFRTTQSKSAA
jgi:hypothetical protein